MTDYPSLTELRESIEDAIKQGGNSNYLLNDYNFPYVWGYYLHDVEAGGRKVLIGGIIPATVIQTKAQLGAALAGEEPEGDTPKYNIDWDIRNSMTDRYLQLKKEDGTIIVMMGTFDFDTAEQGAERWLEQIKERVAKGLWMTWEEKQAQDKKYDQEFQEYFDAHCSDTGDCEWKASCEVRYPGGHGLRGCRRENPDDDEMWKR